MDPSTKGATAALDGREVVALADIPTHIVAAKGRADRAELDSHTLHALIGKLGLFDHTFVEKVGARPDQGTVSMWRLRRAIYAVLVAIGIPTTYALPQAGQRCQGTRPAPDAARQPVAQLSPQIARRMAKQATDQPSSTPASGAEPPADCPAGEYQQDGPWRISEGESP